MRKMLRACLLIRGATSRAPSYAAQPLLKSKLNRPRICSTDDPEAECRALLYTVTLQLLLQPLLRSLVCALLAVEIREDKPHALPNALETRSAHELLSRSLTMDTRF